MAKKNVWIVLLMLVTGLAYICINQILLPEIHAQETLYESAQLDAYTHDITQVMDYRSPYMGNASNTGNLFYHLPLHQYPMTFSMEPETCALTVHYETASASVKQLQAQLAYNTLAAMSAIDNLQSVRYAFTDGEYYLTRQLMESQFGVPLSDLLDDTANWQQAVEEKIFDEATLSQWFPDEAAS